MSETTRLHELLASNAVLVADGGMGTLLLERGLKRGGCPELLNVDLPEVVAGIHREYVAAGADIILTNTFGGSKLRLEHYGLDGRARELNIAAVEVARSVADAAGRTVAVAGSIGPTAQLMEPFGPLGAEQAQSVFREQAEALAGAGVDVLWIETMADLSELEAAAVAASMTGLPIVTTMSFGSHGRTMMGVAPSDLANWSAGTEVSLTGVGANCGIGPEDTVAAVAEIRAIASVTVVAKANCGLPQMVDGEPRYPLEPDDMVGYAGNAMDAGARIVGACCGSTPEHIAAVRRAVDARAAGSR